MALKQFKYVDKPKLIDTKAIKGYAYAYKTLTTNTEFIIISPSIKKLRLAWSSMGVTKNMIMSRVQKVLVVGEK